MADIFNLDAFGSQEITEAVNKVKYRPRQLGDTLNFVVDPVGSRNVTIDIVDDVLQYYSTGAVQAAEADEAERSLQIRAHRIRARETIRAEEIEAKRRPGDNALEVFEGIVAERNERVINNVQATFEMHRLCALLGVLRNPDNVAIYDLFTQFGVQQSTAAYDKSDDNVQLFMEVEVNDQVEAALGGVPYTGLTIFCGTNAYSRFKQDALDDKLIGDLDLAEYRGDTRYTGFNLIGTNISIVKYRGGPATVAPSFIPTNEAYAVPVGVPDMLSHINAPPVRMGNVNMAPTDLFVASIKELDHGEGVEIAYETCPLIINKRPDAVCKITTQD